MSKFSKIKSFDDYKKNLDVKVTESVKPIHKSVVTKQRKVNESAFKLGDDYKVKITFDIPLNLVSAYIDKVKEETGKNALEFFSEAELAEQMAHYVLKQHLNIDSLPSALSVGESADSDKTEEEAQSDSEALDTEYSTPSDTEESSTDDTESNIDINDSDLNIDNDTENTTKSDDEEGTDINLEGEEEQDETKDEDQDESEINLESDEVNLGEDRDIKATEEEEEYEEITLEDEVDSDLDSESDTIDDLSNMYDDKLTITKMMFYLKHNGIDCSACSSEEVVDIYNEISNKYTIGVDSYGSEIKPSSSDDDLSFDVEDSDLY